MGIGIHQISVAEQDRRRRGVRYATATMVLEGADFTSSPDNAIYEDWINGNITFLELDAKLTEVNIDPFK